MRRRRDILWGTTVGSVLAALGTAGLGPSAAAKSTRKSAPSPWLKRAFHMFTDSKGQSVISELPLRRPDSVPAQWLVRRPAERVTLGQMGPDYMLDFHIANQPNILIPLFGTLVVELKDGSIWRFGHGDILFAEDCTGGGHKSGAGPDGCFSVSVQLPKSEHCLDPNKSPTDLFALPTGAKP